jgi:hypothetical protein
MFNRRSSALKITSIILLIFIGYLFVIHGINYFRVGSFASPLIPQNAFDEISRLYLHCMIFLALGLIVAFLLYKHSRYFISIVVCIVVFAIINYYPEWCM